MHNKEVSEYLQLTYFGMRDFMNCVPTCSIVDMDINFLRRLDMARKRAGVPFKLNSAYRSYVYEKSKGRTGNSSHCKGKAVDIECKDSYKRMLIVEALLHYGLIRIGIYSTFIHVDSDPDKLSCMFIGDK